MKNPVRGSWRWQLLGSAVMLGGAIASGHRALAQSNIVPDATLKTMNNYWVKWFEYKRKIERI